MKEGWEYKRFNEVFDLQMGKTPDRKTPQYFEGDNVWVSIRDMGTKEITDSNEHISDEAIVASNIRKVKKGTVIMSFKLTVGKCAIAAKDLYTNEAIMAFNLKEGYNVTSNFLYYYLRAYKWTGANKAVMGMTLNKATISQHMIGIPPLPEQQQIVEELDLLSSIIEKKKEQLKELDNLAQSIFYDMFGDNNYEIVSLGEVVEIKSTLVSPKELPYSEMLHVSPSNILSNVGNIVDCVKAKEESLISGKYTFSKGMILYSKIRPNLNKVAIPNFDGICSADMYPLSIKGKVNNIFIWRLLLSKGFLEYAIKHSGRARMPKLNRESLFSYTFPLPPLSLQQQFASKIEAIEQQKELIRQSITEVETLFNSRMDYYFT